RRPKWVRTPRKCCSSAASAGTSSRRSRRRERSCDRAEPITEPTRAGPPEARVDALEAAELIDAWPALSTEERAEGFRLLAPAAGEAILLWLPPRGPGRPA